MGHRSTLVLLLAGLSVHCGSEDPTPANVRDAGMDDVDAGMAGDVDASTADAGVDAGSGDGGFVPPAFGEWIQYEPPGAVCANGSPYKFFANFSRASSNVVVYMEGGGACWDYASCTGSGVRSAANRDGIPDGYADALTELLGLRFSAGDVYPLLNDDPSVSPMSDWNKVFLPYCTGDVYSGSRVVTYTDPDGQGDDVEFHHVGHDNVMAAIDMLAAMFPDIPRLLVGGCSAGGSGAMNNYYFFRTGLNVTQGLLAQRLRPDLSGYGNDFAVAAPARPRA